MGTYLPTYLGLKKQIFIYYAESSMKGLNGQAHPHQHPSTHQGGSNQCCGLIDLMYPEGKRFQTHGYASWGPPLITVGGYLRFPPNNRSTLVRTYPEFSIERVDLNPSQRREIFFWGKKGLFLENWSIWEVPKEETRRDET
jgi:hypothetical protein